MKNFFFKNLILAYYQMLVYFFEKMSLHETEETVKRASKLDKLLLNNTNLDSVQNLLEQGANPNFLGHDDRSPLHQAVWDDNLPLAELLLRYGANVNLKTRKRGLSPLHLVYSPYMVDLLVKHGADLMARDNNKLMADDFKNDAGKPIQFIKDKSGKYVLDMFGQRQTVKPSPVHAKLHIANLRTYLPDKLRFDPWNLQEEDLNTTLPLPSPKKLKKNVPRHIHALTDDED